MLHSAIVLLHKKTRYESQHQTNSLSAAATGMQSAVRFHFELRIIELHRCHSHDVHTVWLEVTHISCRWYLRLLLVLQASLHQSVHQQLKSSRRECIAGAFVFGGLHQTEILLEMSSATMVCTKAETQNVAGPRPTLDTFARATYEAAICDNRHNAAQYPCVAM